HRIVSDLADLLQGQDSRSGLGGGTPRRQCIVQFFERAVPDTRLHQHPPWKSRHAYAVYVERNGVFDAIFSVVCHVPLLPWRYAVPRSRVDPPCILFHFDQPYRALDSRAATHLGGALVWASKSVQVPPAHRSMDVSNMAVRLGHRGD